MKFLSTIVVAALATLAVAGGVEPGPEGGKECQSCINWMKGCTHHAEPDLNPVWINCIKDICNGKGPAECKRGTKCGRDKYGCLGAATPRELAALDKREIQAKSELRTCLSCHNWLENCCPGFTPECLKDCKVDMCLTGPEECRKNTPCGRLRGGCGRHEKGPNTLDQREEGQEDQCEDKRDKCFYEDCWHKCIYSQIRRERGCMRNCQRETCLTSATTECRADSACSKEWCEWFNRPSEAEVETPAPAALEKRLEYPPDQCKDKLFKCFYEDCHSKCVGKGPRCVLDCQRSKCNTSETPECRSDHACSKNACEWFNHLSRLAASVTASADEIHSLPPHACKDKLFKCFYNDCYYQCEHQGARCVLNCQRDTCHNSGTSECRSDNACAQSACGWFDYMSSQKRLSK